MRGFGIECEVHFGAADVIGELGLDGMHEYHCHCSDCDPFRTGGDWTCQEDCTADGEFISRVLTYGTERAERAIDTLANALLHGRAGHSTGQGLHVHVSNDGLATNADWVRFWRLWFRYENDVNRLAAGKYGAVRNYNAYVSFQEVVGGANDRRTTEGKAFWDGAPEDCHQMGQPYGRGQINPHTGHDTLEFRIWNATRVGWRIHLAVGVSVAMVEAATQGVLVAKDDDRTLAEVLGPYMTDRSMAALLRAWTWEEAA